MFFMHNNNHGLCCSDICLNGDWEMANFVPLQNQHLSTDHQKLSQMIMLVTSMSVPDLVQIRPREVTVLMGEI